jgi:predicted PurR-regulated permease PerM
MNLARPFVFWISVVAAVTAMVVVLREVLLPFVAGMVLAYLLNPLVLRIERLGINRQLSTGIIIIFVIGIFAILLFLAVPVIVRELAYFIENLPVYMLWSLIRSGLGLAKLSATDWRRPSIRLAILRRWPTSGLALSCDPFGRGGER